MRIKGLPPRNLEKLDQAVLKLMVEKEWLEPQAIAREAGLPLQQAKLWLKVHRIEGSLAYLASPPPPPPVRCWWSEMDEIARNWPSKPKLSVAKLAEAAQVAPELAQRWFRHQRLLRMEEARRNVDDSQLSLQAFAQAAQVTMGQALNWARRQRSLARAAARLGPHPRVSRLGREAGVTNLEAARWLEAVAAGDSGPAREVASDYFNAPTWQEQERIFPSKPSYKQRIREAAEARRWGQ